MRARRTAFLPPSSTAAYGVQKKNELTSPTVCKKKNCINFTYIVQKKRMNLLRLFRHLQRRPKMKNKYDTEFTSPTVCRKENEFTPSLPPSSDLAYSVCVCVCVCVCVRARACACVTHTHRPLPVVLETVVRPLIMCE